MVICNLVDSAEHVHKALTPIDSKCRVWHLYPSFEECQCPQESEGKETQEGGRSSNDARANLPWEGGIRGTVVMVHLTAFLSRLNVTDLFRLNYNFQAPRHAVTMWWMWSHVHHRACSKFSSSRIWRLTMSTGDEFRHLAGCALGFNKVECNPYIYGISSSRVRATHNDMMKPLPPHQPINTPHTTFNFNCSNTISLSPRREVMQHRRILAARPWLHLWFLKITDTNQHSYRNTIPSPKSVLPRWRRRTSNSILPWAAERLHPNGLLNGWSLRERGGIYGEETCVSSSGLYVFSGCKV